MELTNEQLKELKQIVSEVGGTVRSYSGRCMYGKECLGIDFDGALFTLAFYIASSESLRDVFEPLLDNTKTDSMGLGQIVYWPRLSAPSREQREECEFCGCEIGEDEDHSGCEAECSANLDPIFK